MAELKISVSLPGEITETTDPKRGEEAQHASQPIPQSSGSFANVSQLGFWKKFGDDGQLNGGLFRSGDEGSTITPYVSYLKNFFSDQKSFGPLALHSKIDGGFGGYILVPDQDAGEGYAPGMIPSLRGFLGAEQRVLGFRFREGIEQAAAVPLGKRQSPMPIAPLVAGASVGRSVRSAHFSLGVAQHWYLTASDVQDPSPTWNRDHSSAFFKITLPEMSGQLGMDHFKNETRLNIQLSKLFPLLGGTGSFSLASDVATTGEWSSVDHGTFLLLGFSETDRKGRQGVFVKTALDIRQTPGESHKSYIYHHGDDVQKWTPDETAWQAGLDTSRMRFFCKYYEAVGGGDETIGEHYSCSLNDKFNHLNLGIEQDETVWCFENTTRDALTCRVTQGKKGKDQYVSKGYDVQFELTREYNNPYSLFRMQGRMAIKPDRDTMLALMQDHPDLGSFVQALKEMSDTKHMEALNMLAALAYDTYDDTGLDFVLGTDRINSIGGNEIYQTARGRIFDPGKADKTTVCRGVAKMVASVANDLGYEAHAVAINTGGNWHVITALRNYGEKFRFINYGNGTEYSTTRKLEDALLTFAHDNGYPPQLQFVVFDHAGQYERSLITNEGRLLLDSTTPPSALDGFLKFRD